MAGDDNTNLLASESSLQVVRRLAKIRLLRGVPFQYLVPTDAALPVESIRFFHIDQNWLDALIDGALSVTMRSNSDIEWLKQSEPDSDINRYESMLKNTNQFTSGSRKFYRNMFRHSRSKTGNPATIKSGGSMTGLLLRSTIVRDYPGLEISAYKDPESSTGSIEILTENIASPWLRKNWVQTLRMERLSPSILLCIFNDVPTHVRIQEPSESLRMGVDGRPASNSNEDPTSFNLKLKNSDGSLINSETNIRTRSNTNDDSVLDITGLFNDLQARIINGSDITGFDTQDSALIATQMLQLPYQQDFIPILYNFSESEGVSKL